MNTNKINRVFARMSKEARRKYQTASIRLEGIGIPVEEPDTLLPDHASHQLPGQPTSSKVISLTKVIDADRVLNAIRAFCAFGEVTVETVEDGIAYFTNMFWSSAQREGHSLHEVPYRACFKPALATFLLDRLSGSGAVVHDPFSGRGTVCVEAALMGRRASASDINPLSLLLTRPRLYPVPLEDICTALETIDWSAGQIEREDLLTYFHPETLRDIEALRRWLAVHAPLDSPAPDPVADWIRMAAMTRLTGHSSGYMSVKTLPPNQMTTLASQRALNQKHNLAPPARDVRRSILSKSRALLRDGSPHNTLRHSIQTASALHTPYVDNGSVDLVVTSPPFANIVNYGHETWMRNWFAGIVTDNIAFSHHASLIDWTEMMRETLIELMRVVKPGGYIALEVGEIRRGSVKLEKLVWRAAEGLPCRRMGVIVHDAQFTKSAHCYGVTNGALGTNTNRIVLMQRM
jgi:hypothetical protein